MSALIKSLIDKRANTWEQAKAINDAALAAGGEWTAEQDTSWTKHNDDIKAYDLRIKELVDGEERDKAAEETRSKYESAATPPVTTGQRSDEDILRAMARGEIRDANGRVAYEFKAPTERRDLTKGVTTAGGFTVPTSFFGQLQEHMIEMSAIRQTNVTVLTTASGEDLQVPKTTAKSTAVIVAEGAAIGESDPAVGQATLQAFKYGFATQISSELEQDTGVDLVGFLARQGGEALGNGSGTHFITGTGSGQPNGVVTASTLGITGGAAVSGAFTGDNLIDLFFSVIAPYRRRGTWLFDDLGIRDARKLKSTDGMYLWQPSLQEGEPSQLLGRPVVVDPNLPAPALSAKSVVFGDLSTYFIRDVSGVRVERSVDFAFLNDLVTWRFLFRTDGDLIDTTGAVKHFIGNAA